MKKLFFAMLALVALASCSKDEVVQLNQDEIKYSVVAENATKAADVYCNNNKITTFNVWAKVGTTDFIGGTGDVITSSGEGDTWTSNITRYWPEGEVEFYAVAGMANNSIEWNPAGTDSKPVASFPYTVMGDMADENNKTVEDQEDVLYAYEKDAKEDSEIKTGTVNLNFRHALSQIVFNAKNQHPNLYIEISEVQVCGLTKTGTFTYPTLETSNNNFANHPTDGTPSYPDNDGEGDGVGSWAVSTEASDINKSYSVSLTSPAVLNPKTGDDDIVADLTTANSKINKDGAEVTLEYNKKAMLLLPQSQTAYGLTSGSGEGAITGTAYFKIKCTIYNVADNTESGAKTLVYGEVDEDIEAVTGKYACIPFSFTWEPGKKYIYTFVFGDKTNGGVEPDEEGKPDLDNPVLVNIGYTISIDEFVPVPATGNWTTDGTNSSDQTTGDPDPATAA